MLLLCTKHPLKDDNLSKKDKVAGPKRVHYLEVPLYRFALSRQTVCTVSPPPSQEHGPPRHSGGQDPLPVVISPSP